MALLETQHIGFSYSPSEKKVLEDISFEVRRGEILGILGPNGSGKTTLLKILCKLLSPTSGTIRMEGKGQIAFVPQDEEIFLPFTVEQVALMGRAPYVGFMGFESPEDHQKTEAALAMAGLLDFKSRSLMELSGGERQRVFLARSVAQEPELLILDEPTTHLDIRYQMDMLDLYTQLRKSRDMTLIMSLHDLHLAATYCDRILLLREGSLKAIGTPRDILTTKTIQEVFSVPVHVGQDTASGMPYFLPLRKNDSP